MNQNEHPSWDARRLIDQACNRLKQNSRQGLPLDVDSICRSLDSSLWHDFIRETVRLLRELRPTANDSSLIELMATKDTQIATIIKDVLREESADKSEPTSHESEGPTVDYDGGAVPYAPKMSQSPTQIDRFQVDRLLGKGGFGRVYLARDSQLERLVVLKLPRPEKFTSINAKESFIDEAKKVAMFRHSGIVTVYEVGEFEGLPYIVQEYISGGDLKKFSSSRRVDFRMAAKIVAEAADAIGFAHRHRIVHRDLKPENILLDQDGKAWVADFGLAIHEDQQLAVIGEFAGTVRYMSPEQVRRETHRLDGRSDIWSLGVILYQLLSHDAPFRAQTQDQLINQILQQDPRPLRQLDPGIPEDLERICQRCLMKKMHERYSTAFDLAQDLRMWLERTADPKPIVNSLAFLAIASGSVDDLGPSKQVSEQIVPKGLLAFDERDSGFYLQLLPGPRTRNRLPASVQFWKDWIERTDDQAESVGLIYGPSGCGKSSLIRAGIFSRLKEDIATVFIDATPLDTEVRLLAALRKLHPAIPDVLDLPPILAGLRQGHWNSHQTKTLIVLDQFEQWLHGNSLVQNCQLVEALRQCDGQHIQAILLARDDFWMAVSRFFDELELALQQHVNFASVDLFDLEHAAHVLNCLGQAYGKLPGRDLDHDQQLFLKEAVERIAIDSKVICVRLILFAETIKDRPWTTETLRQLGDTHEIGTLYLDQTISSPNANPGYRSRAAEISRVLECLLPDGGALIKASYRTRKQLADAAGLHFESPAFASLLDILDRQLRLIAPTEPDTGLPSNDTHRTNVGQELKLGYYQLTHDFLVPSIRNWLERKERETPAGRARLRLKHLADGWRDTGDRTFIPAPMEFVTIARYVHPAQCTREEQQLYAFAMKRYLRRAMTISAVLVLITIFWFQRDWQNREQRADLRVDQLLSAQLSAIPFAISALEIDPSFSLRAVKRSLSNDELNSQQRIKASIAQATLGGASHETIVSIVQAIELIPVEHSESVLKALRADQTTAQKSIRERYETAGTIELKSQLALTLFHLGDDSLLMEALENWIESDIPFAVIYDIPSLKNFTADYVALLVAQRPETNRHSRLAPIVNGLAGIDFTVVAQKVKEDLRQICGDLFLNSNSAALHSACECLLKRLGQTPPYGKLPIGPPKDPQREWMFDEFGLTFSRIGFADRVVSAQLIGPDIRAADDQPDSVAWICTTELSSELFNSIASAVAVAYFPESVNKEDPELPLTDVTAVQGFVLCNLLSAQAELERVYVETDELYEVSEATLNELPIYYKSPKKWSQNLKSNGYRLPTPSEYLYAAFQERKSLFPPGENRPYAQLFSNFSTLHRSAPMRCGELLPNCFGLFDISGNVSELLYSQNQMGYHVGLDFRRPKNSITQQVLAAPQFVWISRSFVGIRLVRK